MRRSLSILPITLAVILSACGGGEGEGDSNLPTGDGDSDGGTGCDPGSFLDPSLVEPQCVPCEVGQYCPGGTSGPTSCEADGLLDDDRDPATPCSSGSPTPDCEPGYVAAGDDCAMCQAGYFCAGGAAPKVECSAGEVDADNDSATPCKPCEIGTYCPPGAAPIQICGGDTWDHDVDPATACAPTTTCARNEKAGSSDGLSDASCSLCPPNTMPSAPNGASCDLFSIDPATPVPTYTVTVTGAVIAPFDKVGEEWDTDGLGIYDVWNQSAIDSVGSTASTGSYSDAVALADDYVANRGIQLPDIYGDIRLSVRGFPEARGELNTRSSSQAALKPAWTGAGFSHVPFTDDTRLLVSLYDDDLATPDAVAYVMLTGESLAAAAAAGDSVAVRVWGDTGGRVMWLTFGFYLEDAGEANSAPRFVTDGDTAASDAYTPPATVTRTLWVHGLDFDGGTNVVLPYRSEDYWKDNVPTDPLPGPNAVAVNYHGQGYVSLSNVVLQYELDSLCRDLASCYIACHSAGCAQTGYALSTHSNLGTRWNVLEVVAAGSAAGGSELAESGDFVGFGGDLTRDLRVTQMRTLYDHNSLGVEVANIAGAEGGLRSGILLGQDDNAVAYHSSGGVVNTSGGPNGSDFGNPSDSSMYVLPLGYENRTYLFNGHWVWFRDDTESYNHGDVKPFLAQYMQFYE